MTRLQRELTRAQTELTELHTQRPHNPRSRRMLVHQQHKVRWGILRMKLALEEVRPNLFRSFKAAS